MKVAFICHPIAGDVMANVSNILEIVKHINLNEPEVIPFAPYIVDVLALDDNDPNQRIRGIKNGIEILRSGIVDELRVYGPEITQGMQSEIEFATMSGIPIKNIL